MKLFNKQRFRLIKAQRLKTYTVYATGEILLVIIGILIALGINNWNQQRQLENANLKLHQQVLSQLEEDIHIISDFQKDLDSLNQTYRRVLNRTYDKGKILASGSLSTILLEAYVLSLDQRISNLIDNAKLDESVASQKMIDLNGAYKLYLKDLNDIERIIFTKITNNLAEIEQTQDWYAEFITDLVCKNDCIYYLRDDEGHKSRVASLRFLYVNRYGKVIDDFLNDLLVYKADLKALISK